MNLTLSDVNDNEPVWTAGHDTQFNIREVQCMGGWTHVFIFEGMIILQLNQWGCRIDAPCENRGKLSKFLFI